MATSTASNSPMIVMPADNTGMELGILVGRYPGRVGHLYSPGSNKGPHPDLPYALDNGAFPAWVKGNAWDEEAFNAHIKRYVHKRHKPRWILVPDVVADKEATLVSWDKWEPILRAFEIPLAFAVQDGMFWYDVPKSADVVFVGGTTDDNGKTGWKWKTLPMWARHFPRVHVGRVNSVEKLWVCHDFGCESCDGSGWFRGDQDQLSGLKAYLAETAPGARRQQPHLQIAMARTYGPEDER